MSKPGADQRHLLRAVVGAVVDIKPHRPAAAQDALLENLEEGGRGLGEVEGGVGDDAGGVVEQRDQVGLVLAAPGDRGRAGRA